MASSDIEPLLGSSAAPARTVCAWNDCSAEFTSMHLLAAHMSTVHVALHPHVRHACMWTSCPQHDIPFSSRHDLILHLTAHTGGRSYLCPVDDCGKVYKRADFLARHTQSHASHTHIKPRADRHSLPDDSAPTAPELTPAMLDAQLAYIRDQIDARTKQLSHVNAKTRRLRLENDILLDALEHP
ncbi:Zinc finger protein ZIC 2 [Coemansia sp. RSA 2322]|nr:Zinc finger protein ZIC 2 [Coemansia sp. RSA 2322]